MNDSDIKYGALLVDTSIYDSNGLRLEKGLLGKLSQFKKSSVKFLLPDVIKNEVQSHLEKKIKVSRAALEKSLNEAGDHLFFDGSELNDAKKVLVDSKEIEGLAETRLSNFISTTNALILECGDHVSVSELLSQYFSNSPPFAETGKKKNEFPDAIVLLAVQAWAESNDISVLAIAKDGDWKKFCANSERIDYQDDLSNGLTLFNIANAPYALLANLEKTLEEGNAQGFLSNIESLLESIFDGFTPDQEADSHLYWEPEGCQCWLKEFHFDNNKFHIIDKDEDWVVLKNFAVITIKAEGEFSFSFFDSFDKDYTYMGGITTNVITEFESEVLITVSGNLDGPVNELSIDEIEIVSPISKVDFGLIEPDYT